MSRDAEPSRKTDTGMRGDLSFVRLIEHHHESDGAVRKGERTRRKLKAAAAKLLEKDGYNGLKQAEIAELAQVSSGTFYLYFKDKKAITSEVLADFIQFCSERLSSPGRAEDAFHAILNTHLQFLQVARANAGLVRCLLQLSDEEPDFNDVRMKFGSDWYRIVAQSIVRRLSPSSGTAGSGTADAVLLATYCLGHMMDEVVRRLYVARDVEFGHVSDSILKDDRALAEFLALIWYRTIYGREPAGLISEGARSLSAIAAMDVVENA